MADTMRHAEVGENRSRVAAETERLGIPETSCENDDRRMDAEPTELSVADIVARVMDKYDKAFEELAKL